MREKKGGKPVATECVKEKGESKAEDGADEEEEEDELLPDIEVSVALVAQWLHVEDNGANHKGNEPDQVSPDIACKTYQFFAYYSLDILISGTQSDESL